MTESGAAVRRPPRPAPRRRGPGPTGVAGLVLFVAALVLAGAAVAGDEDPTAADAATDAATDAAEDGAAATTATPTTPLVDARRVPEWTTRPVAARNLGAAVDAAVAGANGEVCVAVGDTERLWYEHLGGTALVPASTLKLLTAAVALEVLGPDTVLTTSFRATAEPVDGVVQGDLWVVGGGDPLLTSDAYQQRLRNGPVPETDLEAVADQLVAAGVRTVTGSLVGDGSRHADVAVLPTWPQRFLTQGTVAPLSALLANDGWQIDPTSGEGPGGPAADPSAHAAAVLTSLLVQRGVMVGGAPRSGTAPPGAVELLAVDSLPVAELAGELLRFSDNTTGELLLREVGLAASGEPTTAAGIDAVLAWASEAGIPLDGVQLVDGSGLSYENRLTCGALVGALRRTGPEGVVAAGLAVPGAPGTLSDRFTGGEWAERLRAKTGTLNSVTALAGWLTSRPGTPWGFGIIANTGERRVATADLALQQRILEALLDQPSGPGPADAGPLPAVPR